MTDNDDDLLDRAIRAITAEPIPDSARSRALDRALAIADARVAQRPRRRWLSLPEAIAAVLIVAVTVAILLPALSRARSQHGPMHDMPSGNGILREVNPAASRPTTSSRPAGQPEPFPSREAATKSSRGRQPPE
jgi:hypothetical protein